MIYAMQMCPMATKVLQKQVFCVIATREDVVTEQLFMVNSS